jgi:hypothetical protein
MSATDILKELPNLTASEMRLIRERLVELTAQNEDIAICDQSALDAALMLDRMEEDHAPRQSR